ncbi:MAG: glycerate kinase [Pseudomonadota bacterium]
MNSDQASTFLLDLFHSAVAASGAQHCLAAYLPSPPVQGRSIVIGAGKAAAAMASTVEAHWRGDLSGLVVTRYGHGVACEKIEVLEAAHPVPDQAGQRAAQRILDLVQNLTTNDLVLCLMSGGGSALLSLPAAGISLQEKQAINRALLTSGASIAEINCVRKHLSAIKGGRLALACGAARVVTLLISDVAGDDPATIASGPTLPDATTCADALAVLRKFAIALPPSAQHHLASGAGETPKPGDPRFAHHSAHIIANAQQALEAAAATARAAGITPYILSDRIEGEARQVGQQQATLARQIAAGNTSYQRPCVLLSGGETTVTVRGQGRGGRNAEFLLSLAVALEAAPAIHALACDTDGIDGSEHNAGALCQPDTLLRAGAFGLKADAMLDDNDAYSFFASIDDLVVTGPTRTNVNDFRAILIL